MLNLQSYLSDGHGWWEQEPWLHIIIIFLVGAAADSCYFENGQNTKNWEYLYIGIVQKKLVVQ